MWVRSWGVDQHGSLGHGDFQHEDRPKLVEGLRGIRVVEVSMGDEHTLALAADGTAYAFGTGPGLGITPESDGDDISPESEGYEEHDTMRSPNPQILPGLICMVPP
jgi:alpha-tubulin suppressor-like RCC1 family protein